MAKEFKYAICSIKKNIKDSAELRISFITNIFGMVMNNVAFLILWMTFAYSIGPLNGWAAMDIIGMNGFLSLSYGVISSVFAGIYETSDYVTTGVFDKIMLSPKNLLVRLSTSSFNVSAFGDIVFGVVCLFIYGFSIQAGLYQVMLILLLFIISTILFLAVMIAIMSASFLFVDSNTVVNSLFELFLTPSLFHGGAFQGVMRFIFTFIVPSLLLGTLPVEIVKTLSLEKLAIVSVLAVFWLFVSVKLFYRGVRKYESSNLMTFGR